MIETEALCDRAITVHFEDHSISCRPYNFNYYDQQLDFLTETMYLDFCWDMCRDDDLPLSNIQCWLLYRHNSKEDVYAKICTWQSWRERWQDMFSQGPAYVCIWGDEGDFWVLGEITLEQAMEAIND